MFIISIEELHLYNDKRTIILLEQMQENKKKHIVEKKTQNKKH